MKLSIIICWLALALAGCDEGDAGMTCEECSDDYEQCSAECQGDGEEWIPCWEENCVAPLCHCLEAMACVDELENFQLSTGEPLCQDY